MTVSRLIASGYRKFHDPFKAVTMTGWYRASYQKRVVDGVGTRYFITISHSIRPGLPAVELFEPSNQFSRNGLVFNVTTLWRGETIEQVETFFAEMWEKLKLDYYEKSCQQET